jgi:N12 class adenine-specific DNA methylase
MDMLELELDQIGPPVHTRRPEPVREPEPELPQPSAVADPMGPPVEEYGNPLVRGFRAGFEGQNVQATGQFTQDLAAMLDSERLDRWGQKLEEVGRRRGAPHQARVPNLRAIRSLDDALDYAGHQVGQGVASSLPSLAAGLAGGVAGSAAGPIGTVVGAGVGAFSSSYVLNEGDISQELEDKGVTDPKERAAKAAKLAIPVAGLDALPTGRLLRILMGGRAPREIAERGLLHGLKRIGAQTGKQAGAEAVTEGAQEALQGAGTSHMAGQPVSALETLERAVEGAVAGGLAGGAMGGGAQTFHELRHRDDDGQIPLIDDQGQPTPAQPPGAPPPTAGASPPPASGAPEGPAAGVEERDPTAALLDDTQLVSDEELEVEEDLSEPSQNETLADAVAEANAPPIERVGKAPFTRHGYPDPVGRPAPTLAELDAERAAAAVPRETAPTDEAEDYSDIEDPDLPPMVSEPEDEGPESLDDIEAEIAEGSRYADEDQPEELLKAAEKQARAHWRRALEAQEQLADGTEAMTGKPIPASTKSRLEKELVENDRLYRATMNELEQAFGTETAERIQRRITTLRERPPAELDDDELEDAERLTEDEAREDAIAAEVKRRADLLEQRARKEQLDPGEIENRRWHDQTPPEREFARRRQMARLREKAKTARPIRELADAADKLIDDFAQLSPRQQEHQRPALQEEMKKLHYEAAHHGIVEDDLDVEQQIDKAISEHLVQPGWGQLRRQGADDHEILRHVARGWPSYAGSSGMGHLPIEWHGGSRDAKNPNPRLTVGDKKIAGKALAQRIRRLLDIPTTTEARERAEAPPGPLFEEPQAPAPAKKKPPTPQVPHGVAGPDAKYVLPSFVHGHSGLLTGSKTPVQTGTNGKKYQLTKKTRKHPHHAEPVTTYTLLEDGQPIWTGGKEERAQEVLKEYVTTGTSKPPESTAPAPSAEPKVTIKKAAIIPTRGGGYEAVELTEEAPDAGRDWWENASKRQREAVFLNAGINPEDATRWADLAYENLSEADRGLVQKRAKGVQAPALAAEGSTPNTAVEVPASPAQEESDDRPDNAGSGSADVRPAVAADDSGSEPGGTPAPREDGRADVSGAVVPGDRGSTGGERADAAAPDGPAAAGSDRPSGEARQPHAKGPRDSDRRPAGDVPRLPAGRNYRLTDADKIGAGTPTEKVEGNLAAIRLLKEIEAAGRPATAAEQAVLAKYVGWGGLADVFDPQKPMAVKYGPELAGLLTEDEFKSARASTPNAHYTSPEVIRAIFDTLARMGFSGGKLLEPSMGVGNFLGFTPKAWAAKWTGIELDAITGRIAKLLYPESSIRVNGFESVQFPDKTFDVVVSNVPFGNYPVSDRRYEKKRFITKAIHKYFFGKSLDLVRPGGLIAFVTSRYVMDEENTSFRDYISERADFVGAVRLPSLAFKENADTEVVTDVIFLRRFEASLKAGPSELRDRGIHPAFTSVVAMETQQGSVWVNEYYRDHPNMIVGSLQKRSGRYGAEPTVTADPETYPLLLRAAMARLPAGVYTPEVVESPATSDAAEEAALEAPGDVKEGGFAVVRGELYQRFDGKLTKAQVPAAARDRVTRLVTLIEQLRGLIQAERLDRPEADVEGRRKKLRDGYRAFVKKYGPVTKEVRTSYVSNQTGKEVVTTSFPNLKIIRDDPSSSFLFALEQDYDLESGTAKEGGILSHRTVKPERGMSHAASPADALPFVLNETGRVDLERIAALVGSTPDQAARELFAQGLIYDDPASDQWVTADEYLSGDVRAKLAQASAAAKREPRYEAHRKALEAVIPEDLTPGQIHVSTGAPWIPTTDVEAFAQDLFGNRGRATVRYLAHDGSWHIKADWGLEGSAQARVDYGTKRINGVKLLELAFNNRAPIITDPKPDGGRVKNLQDTIEAEAKWQQIRDRFAQWVWEDPKRADRLVRYYNDNFNNIRLREYDGSHLEFPGQTKVRRGEPFALDKHQRDAAWRILQGNTLLAHVVGAGKTYTMIAAGMEAKRLGLAKKPIFAVPNHLLGQFQRDFRDLYPSAQLLVAETEDVSPKGRARFLAKATGSNWDGIIITHSSFEKIPMSLEFQEEFLDRQIAELEDLIRSEKERGDRKSATVKDIEKAKKRLEAKIKKLRADWKKDDLLQFEQIGADMLFVDEADLYKNLWIASRRRGVAIDGSQRAFDLYLKTRYMDELHPGWGVVFATGTPIANSVGEMYTMQRYLGRRHLEGAGLGQFDGWASTFGEDVTGLEMRPDGSGYRMKTRFARFKNVPELVQMFRTFADVKLAEDLNLKVPKLLTGKPITVASRASAKLRAYVKTLLKRGEELDPARPDLDNWLKIVGDGRHAALDVRFVDPDPDADPEGKLAKAAENVLELYQKHKAHRGTQLIFSDLGTPKDDKATKAARKKALTDSNGDELEDEETGEGFELTPRGGIPGFNVYDAMKAELIRRGIPASEIAFIHDANTEVKKLRLFADVNAGRIRVLMGSTEKMGAGTNVQMRLVAEHHLDAPWRPRDVEQREGRIIRQGNLLYDKGHIEGVAIYRYGTEESFDTFMWGTLERKALMIAQIMKGDLTVREIEDIDAPAINNFAQMKAITSGNPAVMEKATVDADIQKLDRLRKGHLDQQFRVRQELLNLPRQVEAQQARVEKIRKDVARREDTTGDKFTISIGGKEITKRPEAGEALKARLAESLAQHSKQFREKREDDFPIGSFAGFTILYLTTPQSLARALLIVVGTDLSYTREVTADDTPASLLSGLEHMVAGMDRDLKAAGENADRLERELADMRARADAAFEKQAELDELLRRQASLNALLTKEDKKKPGTEDVTVTDREGDQQDDEDLEGDEDEEGGLGRGGFLNLPAIADALARRKERDEALQPFEQAEVEEAWQAAKGLSSATVRQKVDDAIRQVRESLRHFAQIDPAAGALEARSNQILLEIENAQSWAQAQAIHRIRTITKGLTEPEVDLLARHFALNDLQKDVEAGLYEGRDLPFHLTAEQLTSELIAVKLAVSENPKVARAIGLRTAFAKALTEQLVAADQLPEKVLQDDRYYHRQVLEYFNALPPATQRPGTSAQEARVHQKGFQRSRVGGGDFNTRYHEAEFEWVAQAYRILHMVAKLEELKQLADIQPRLKAEAKALNLATLKASMEPEDLEDALGPFAQRIGAATSELYKLALDDKLALPGFEHLLAQLAGDYAAWKGQPRRAKGEGRRPPFRFAHPQWFTFLRRLMERNEEGAVQAGVIFKALNEREEKIEALLGRQYRTWEKIIPEGWRIWQPVKGNHFFQALGIAERALHQVLAGEKTLQPEDLRELLVLGPAREQWVIPTWLADTMDGFGKIREQTAPGKLWVYLEQHWKRWQLLNPLRLLKYNFNNLSGDLDAVLLQPGILRHTAQAVRDLWAYRTEHASKALAAEIHEWMRLRVIDQGLTVVEIPDLSEVAAFKELADPNPFRFMYWVSLYWRKAKGLTLFRENIFRLAAARYYHDRILQGRPTGHAASNAKELKHITDPRQRAAKLSRDLIGDYGNISSGGQWARDRLFPFFSWQEINAKRYVNVARNVLADPKANAGKGGLFLAKRTTVYAAKRLLQVNAFFLLLSVWNALFFGDEEEEMRQRGRNLHIILGRYRDGSVRSIRIEGAWADFLEWLHLHDYPSDIEDVTSGRKTLGDKVQEMTRSPLEKIWGMWEPVSKTLGEVFTKRATYPTPFDTRPIRDRWEHVFSSVSLSWLYKKVMDKPLPPGSAYTQFLLMRTEPGEAAFFGLKEKVSDWQEAHGKERSNPNPTERDNALYYWRKSLEWGEEEKADRWLKRYMALGGTRENARASVKRQRPLSELTEDDRRAFLSAMDADTRAMLLMATEWYNRGLRATSGPSMGRTPPPPKGARP